MIWQIVAWSVVAVSTLAAVSVSVPPPAPNLWPLAIGLIVLGVSGLITSLIWSRAWIRSLVIKKREVTRDE